MQMCVQSRLNFLNIIRLMTVVEPSPAICCQDDKASMYGKCVTSQPFLVSNVVKFEIGSPFVCLTTDPKIISCIYSDDVKQ